MRQGRCSAPSGGLGARIFSPAAELRSNLLCTMIGADPNSLRPPPSSLPGGSRSIPQGNRPDQGCPGSRILGILPVKTWGEDSGWEAGFADCIEHADWQDQPDATTISMRQGRIINGLRTRPLNITATCFQYRGPGRRTGLRNPVPARGCGFQSHLRYLRRFTHGLRTRRSERRSYQPECSIEVALCALVRKGPQQESPGQRPRDWEPRQSAEP
jgi:hypothetical protein